MCNSIPNPSLAPAPRSYHLLTTLSPTLGHKLLGTLYPYRTRICCYDDENSLFSTRLTSLPPQRRHPGTYKLRVLKALVTSFTSRTPHDADEYDALGHLNQRGKAYTFRTSIEKKSLGAHARPCDIGTTTSWLSSHLESDRLMPSHGTEYG